jgi:hypothetical protein
VFDTVLESFESSYSEVNVLGLLSHKEGVTLVKSWLDKGVIVRDNRG